MEKNKIIELVIEDMLDDGRAFGRCEGCAVFVSGGAVPGDTVKAKVTKVKKSSAEAALTEVTITSADRAAAECPYFGECGGCAMQELAYDAQKRLKTEQVRAKLKRLGGIEDPKVNDCIGAETLKYYRNKAVFAIGPHGEVGFMKGKSHFVIDIDDCLLQSDAAMVCADALRTFLKGTGIRCITQLTVKTERIGGKILEVYNITKSYQGIKMVDDYSYVFKKGEKIGIVGPNGIGKSTFLNLITEQLRPDSGRVIVGQTIRFGFYTQNGMTAPADRRVIDIVKDVAEQIELDNGKDMSAHQFLTYFGFDDTTQYNYFGNLSGGERRRLYLLKVLMANPNFLILDEPTNDLDIYTLEILEQFLRDYKGCLIIVSHDRSFMDHIVDHLLVFEGNGHIKDYHGNYTQYREEKDSQRRTQEMVKRDEKPKYTRSHSDKPRASYKEQKEYEALTAEIDTLTQEKTALETLLADGTGTDLSKLTSASERIGQIIAKKKKKELRWLELDELIN